MNEVYFMHLSLHAGPFRGRQRGSNDEHHDPCIPLQPGRLVKNIIFQYKFVD